MSFFDDVSCILWGEVLLAYFFFGLGTRMHMSNGIWTRGEPPPLDCRPAGSGAHLPIRPPLQAPSFFQFQNLPKVLISLLWLCCTCLWGKGGGHKIELASKGENVRSHFCHVCYSSLGINISKFAARVNRHHCITNAWNDDPAPNTTILGKNAKDFWTRDKTQTWQVNFLC